jgi:hypothetical protein
MLLKRAERIGDYFVARFRLTPGKSISFFLETNSYAYVTSSAVEHIYLE